MAPRSKPSASELESVLDRMLLKLPETLRQAQENGATGARATIESCNNTIRVLEGALGHANEQIKYYEALVKAQFADWANVLKKNAEAAQVGSDERVKIATVNAEADFKKTLVKELAPAAPPVFQAILKKLGLAEDDSLLLNASADDVEIDRATYWEMINTIAVRPDIQAVLSDALGGGQIGKEKWSRVLAHLQREYAIVQAKLVGEQAKTNGVSN